MAYTAFITRIKNLHPHPNADRLQIGECFGNQIVVSLEYTDNQLGIYFPSDGQVSVEFAEVNNLLRKKDENGNNIGGYMDADKRNVTAIKLRGERSDGLFLPIKSLETFGDITTLHEGDRIDNFNGHEICCKYIPRKNVRQGHISEGNRTRKKKVPIAPLFTEHADTEQLAYNLGAFKPGDEIEITLKMHGTSQRTGYVPVLKGYKCVNPIYQYALDAVNNGKEVCSFVRKMADRAIESATPIYEWGYVSGTRRTVLENYDGGYYGSNEFREQHSKFFEGKLWNFIKSLCEQIILLYLLVHFLLKGVKRHQVAVELVIQGRCLVASVGLVKNIVALLRVEHQFYLVAFVQNTHYLLVILLAHHLKVGEVLHLLLVKS